MGVLEVFIVVVSVFLSIAHLKPHDTVPYPLLALLFFTFEVVAVTLSNRTSHAHFKSWILRYLGCDTTMPGNVAFSKNLRWDNVDHERKPDAQHC